MNLPRPTEWSELHGRSVLVKSALDRRNPPAARRGSLVVRSENAAGRPDVRVVLEFPDLFNAAAHQRSIPLDDRLLEELFASEKNGAYELTIAEPLD